MYQKDYILRMVEMLADMLAAILSYIKKGEFKQATVALEYTYQNLLKEDASFFHNIPVDQLTDKLIHEHNYTNGHLEILSELFFVEAELQYKTGNTEKCFNLYQKTIVLFKFLEKENKIYSEDRQLKSKSIEIRMNEIQTRM